MVDLSHLNSVVTELKAEIEEKEELLENLYSLIKHHSKAPKTSGKKSAKEPKKESAKRGRPKGSTKFTDEQRKEMLESQEPVKELAKRLKVTPSAIYMTRKRAKSA